MINIKNLSKKIGNQEILKNISFDISPGSIYGLIGENGVGKTTLLRSMAGIYSIDTGDVIYNDIPLKNNITIKSNISYVCDEFNFFPNYKVSEIIVFYEKLYPKFSISKFNFYNHTFNIPKDKKIFTLSKGMKAKLNLMLAFSNGSEFLLLDEPINGLDPMSKNNVLKSIITKASDDNSSIIISSHNLNELEKICDKILFMKKGTIAISSDIDQIKKNIIGIQVFFSKGVPSDLYNLDKILDIKGVIGKVAYISTDDYSDELLKKLESMGATSIEKIDLSLEDIFISSYEGWKKN